MIIRLSTAFLRTLREDPSDAEVVSHRLLTRAGYVRRVAPGVFTLMPLGLRVLHRIETIIRTEMEAVGAQEMAFPALLPREPYEKTGRWMEYGPTLFRLRDRRGADFLLGPTHEEMFTLAVRDMYSSYKDLPVTLYQIQTKYRDEARPRAGILRGREFLMKDSYSFDIDDEGLNHSYANHRSAYIAIFDQLGLDYVICSAMAGAMGGSMSEEFLAICDIGEDTLVRCDTCGYAANVEAVRTVVPEPSTEARPLRTVLYSLVDPAGQRTSLAISLPAERKVDPKRLDAQVAPATVEPFTADDEARHRGLAFDKLDPRNFSKAGIRHLVDPRIPTGSRWTSPAAPLDVLICGDDFRPDGVIDAAEVRSGDACPECSGRLSLARGIEIGHIFQLGRKYAEAFGLTVADETGKPVTVTMGSYGIGLTRALGAIAEQTSDAHGLCWPRAVAPADVHIVAAGRSDTIRDHAQQLAAGLADAGRTVILDDRNDVSPGVKFADADLLGVPTIAIIGRALANGQIEIKDRRTGDRQAVPVGAAVGRLCSIVSETPGE